MMAAASLRTIDIRPRIRIAPSPPPRIWPQPLTLPHIALPAFHAFAARSDDARAAFIASRFSPGSPRARP